VRLLSLIAVAATLACAAAGGSGAAGAAPPPEPLLSQEWWLPDIRADHARQRGPRVPLTIVSDGIDVTHPELAHRPATVLLNPQSAAGDGEAHGTAAASLAAAPANGVGLLGVYPRALLQSWDAGAGSGLAGYSEAIGIETAARRCPGVIDLGAAGTAPDPFVEQAILVAVHRGCLVVAPAGDGRSAGSPPTYPASLPHVLTVAATGRDDRVAAFSTAGAGNDVAAPGDALVAAVTSRAGPSPWGGVAGTEDAAAIAAAVAAWVWSARPHLDAGQVAELLRRTARDVPPRRWDPDTGFGIVDVAAALRGRPPVRDRYEPNDDVVEVKPGEVFSGGEPALTSADRASRRLVSTLDANEDPEDVYRIHVPAYETVRVHVSGAHGNAAARIWGPRTLSVREGLQARRRDLRGSSLRAGAHGLSAYVEVLLTGRRPRTRYTLSVTASSR
jgi:subtilase family protein